MLKIIRISKQPLFHLRKSRSFRFLFGFLLRFLDVPIFISIADIAHPVCVRLWSNISIVLGREAALESAERVNFKKIALDREANVLWDVGANIGHYAFDFLSVAPKGRVVALEPDKRNAAMLRRTISRSNLSVQVLELAASDSEATKSFYTDDLTGSTGSLVKVEGATFNERYYGVSPRIESVQTTTLDLLLHRYEAPDILKVDVEGNELAVLCGASRLLREIRPVILLEINAAHDEIVRLLKASDYRILDARTLAESITNSNVFAIPC